MKTVSKKRRFLFTITDYAGGYIYENSSLKFASHAEGYIEPDGGGGYNYVYQYKDHLGNVRLSYTDSNGDGIVDVNEIVEESNYYPFGLKHRGYNSAVNGMPNKFLTYNGVEFEEALGLNMYEMDMRHYDAAIARWIVQDPIIHHSLSPYNAFDNNPVYWADPSGADSVQDLIADVWNKTPDDGLTHHYNNQGEETGTSEPDSESGDSETSVSEDSSSVNTNAVNTDSVINNTGNNQRSSVNQDPCPKCPDKDIRRLAIMMANHTGGNAQTYYDAMADDDFIADRISDNVTGVMNIALITEVPGITELLKRIFLKKTVKKLTTSIIVQTGVKFSKHSLKRLAERGVTSTMAKKAIEKGVKYYDPKTKTINYILKNAFASGKSLLVGTNPATGQITTVIRSSKNLVNKRFIKINQFIPIK